MKSITLAGNQRDDGVPSFVEVNARTDDELHALLQTLMKRPIKLLTRPRRAG